MTWSPPPLEPFSWTEAQRRYLAEKLGELRDKDAESKQETFITNDQWIYNLREEKESVKE